MATNYPTGFDTFVNPLSTDTTVAVDHASQHANANDAIAALQVKVGINNSTDSASLDSRVQTVCTSLTRPTGTAGRTIFETDTGYRMFHNGSAWVCITPLYAEIATSQTATSTSYTDLSTVGPAVSIQTGTSALVTLAAQVTAGTAGVAYMSVAVSGATTVAAADTAAMVSGTTTSTAGSTTFRITGLTAGVNTFTCKYRTTAGTSTWVYRRLTVVGDI